MNRAEIEHFITESFDAQPEYLWKSHPNFAVFRTPRETWFGIIMNIPAHKLTGYLPQGVSLTDEVDVLNVKVSPDDTSLLTQTPGIFPAYHMNKTHWISIGLNMGVDEGFIYSLISQSFDLAFGR